MKEEVFVPVWQALCQRFDHDVDLDEAQAYMDYLDTLGMEEDDFLQAAGRVWATREFFPRPVDFVLAAHAGLLSQIRKSALAWSKHERGWLAMAGGKDSMAMEVVRSLGGMDQAMKLLDRGPDVFRREVEAHLDQVLMSKDHLPALGGPSGEVGTLPAAGEG